MGVENDGVIDYKQFSDLLFESTHPDDEATSFIQTSKDFAATDSFVTAYLPASFLLSLSPSSHKRLQIEFGNSISLPSSSFSDAYLS